MATLNELSDEIYAYALDKGWYSDDEGNPKVRNFGEIVALVHSELSEALEEWRKGYAPTFVYYRESDGKPEGIAVEMADAIIRILDWCASEGVDIDSLVREKMEFNMTRPYKHGKIA